MAAALPSVRTTPPATLAVELIPLCLRLQRLPPDHAARNALDPTAAIVDQAQAIGNQLAKRW